MSSRLPEAAEWLEADGLGGFASGTVGLVRTRRYHALLLSATTPPTGRLVLVNGVEAWVETPRGIFALSSQRYTPDVTHPDGASRIESFEAEPWPKWRFRFDDGVTIEQEIFVPHETSACVLRWRVLPSSATTSAESTPPAFVRLHVRPLLSGRDYHSMHHENDGVRFDARVQGERVAWRPYDSVPGVTATSNAGYTQAPEWYRGFQYDAERARGLDFNEDLASPGVFTWDLTVIDDAVLIFAMDVGPAAGLLRDGENAASAVGRLAAAEVSRRRSFASPLHRAADAYLVRRGEGKTIVAGYPWFTDWGRDTFIALRGLCLAGNRLEDARAILTAWAGAVSEGMLPNRFPDAGGEPEYNAVDASLWYVVAVFEYLRAGARCEALQGRKSKRASAAGRENTTERAALLDAVEAILDGYARGARFGIRCDGDGLLAAGQPGVQLTWMDAKIGDWVVTPRIGKPVEVQALWINALRVGATLATSSARRWEDLAERATRSFAERFWNESRGCLYDVVDVDHAAGTTDGSMRPNQILAVGGLPFALLEGERARKVVDAVEAELLTPLGLRSLAASQPGYSPHYAGGPRERDAAYHQGTVWPWLLGPFVEAWVRVRGGTGAAKRDARARFLDPLLHALDRAGIGHVPEIADAEPPHSSAGCPFQAWSVGELLRLDRDVLATSSPAKSTDRARESRRPSRSRAL